MKERPMCCLTASEESDMKCFCQICGEPFETNRPQQRYCGSKACLSERRRREARHRRSGLQRVQRNHKRHHCAVCGEVAHPGVTCREVIPGVPEPTKKPARCACGHHAVVNIGHGGSHVVCTYNQTCWMGPSRETPDQAIDAWDRVMKLAADVRRKRNGKSKPARRRSLPELQTTAQYIKHRQTRTALS